MNCCDAFGNCNQGRDCPVRMHRVCPDHITRAADNGAAPEGGNVYAAEPTDTSDLSLLESAGAYFLVIALALASFTVLAGLAGYVVGRWIA